jgi:hypothetical protein
MSFIYEGDGESFSAGTSLIGDEIGSNGSSSSVESDEGKSDLLKNKTNNSSTNTVSIAIVIEGESKPPYIEEGAVKKERQNPFTNDPSCSICLEDYNPSEKLILLPCKHAFHPDCIKPWLCERSGCCPLCKKVVMKDGKKGITNSMAAASRRAGTRRLFSRIYLGLQLRLRPHQLPGEGGLQIRLQRQLLVVVVVVRLSYQVEGRGRYWVRATTFSLDRRLRTHS